ncbi:MAG TPA: SDR family oxidoreductase [Chloroflexota bacterium]|nr:SDR family oxidoreductase [Chloroflexota bacterium]
MTLGIDLSGKAALVTGGSRGLGAAMCRHLAAAGASVAVHYASAPDRASRVAAAIKQAGGRAVTVGGDFHRASDVERVAAEAQERLGPIGILVNNVGREEALGPAVDLGWEGFEASLELNVRSAYLLTRALVPGMRRIKYGRIVNILSMAAHSYPKGMAAYSTAKTAFAGFTRAMAVELGPDGITVNSVSPGWIPVERHGPSTLPGRMATAARTPLGHLGTPDDVSWAVAFLASPQAGFITGVEIPVCGGAQLLG